MHFRDVLSQWSIPEDYYEGEKRRMRMENLAVKRPKASNIVKARITAYSMEEAKKAADLLSTGWTHHTIKRIMKPGQQNKRSPELFSYYILLWNEDCAK